MCIALSYIYIINNGGYSSETFKTVEMKTLTIKRVKSEIRVEQFNAMEWLKSGREWAIDRILEHHSRKDLVAVMTAVKDAVMACDNEDDALRAVDNVILDFTGSAELNEFFAQQRESLKRTVFH